MKYIFGNWKMYLNHAESVSFAKKLAKSFSKKKKGIEMAVFPTALSFASVRDALKKSAIKMGAQNCAWIPKGAYTGAVSALLFKEAGAKYVLAGHSERRYIFGESNDDIKKKVEAILDAGLVPVLCVGETEKDHKDDKIEYRLKKQLMESLSGLEIPEGGLIVAYEPVWAIGTGNPCHPKDADERHKWIKNELRQYVKGEVPVLYGGSVNKDNAAVYMSLDSVDGILVGGASVKTDTFLPLVKTLK